MAAVTSIRTTRDELLRTRRALATAQQGKEILEKKKEALLGRFLIMVRQYKGKREALLGDLVRLKGLLALTVAREGTVTIRSLALATSQRVELDIAQDNIMGTVIFRMKAPALRRDLLSRGYNPASVSARIESVASVSESVLERMLTIAHIEYNLKVVGREMGGLNRKINALDEITIPEFKRVIRYIQDALEQNEREEIFRLKMIKRVQAAKAAL